MVCLQKKLIAIRDPFGIRPLVIGTLGKAKIIASETCALDIIGAKFEREVLNGEIVVMDHEGMKTYRPFHNIKSKALYF